MIAHRRGVDESYPRTRFVPLSTDSVGKPALRRLTFRYSDLGIASPRWRYPGRLT
jgi:hypothetical protein